VLGHHRDFWHSYTTLNGRVDLRCGLSCFGDSGLKALFGTAIGLDPGELGRDPGQVLSFSVAGRLPGQVRRSNAAAASGGFLRWTTPIGKATVISAQSSTLNDSSVAVVAAGGAGAVVLVALASVWFLRRRRRRRRLERRRARAATEAVSPPS
jgi:hypothetical protein